MMYFSRLKTWLVLGTCLLGVLFCIPNLMAPPAAGLPWRQVHLGLDLRGGSYLLMQVDMSVVVKERLDSLADAARQALIKASVGYQNLAPDAAHDRVTLRLRDPSQQAAALAALRDMATAGGATPDFDVAPTQDALVALTLSDAALRDRATNAVQQSIEIVRRRIDETGVVDPQITRQGADRIVVQLPGIQDPNRIKELLGQTAKMTFQLVDETANPAAPPPDDLVLSMQANPNDKIVVQRRVAVDGASLTDARAGQNPQTGDVGSKFHLRQRRQPALRRHHARLYRPSLRYRAGQPGAQRACDPGADHRRAWRDQRQLHRRFGH